MEEPEIQKVKVLDVMPYRHGVYCSIKDGQPFVNEIVGRQWSDDGDKVIFMLETHNFLFEPHDGELDVVILKSGRHMVKESQSDFLSKRPGFVECESCHGKGRIEMVKNP